MKPQNLFSRIGKLVAKIFGLLIGIIFILLVLAFIIYPGEYVYRMLVWQESDVHDYRENFPQRRLTAAAVPYHFDEAPDVDRVTAVFERQPDIEDLDEFLSLSDTEAFIVIQDKTVLYEKYFNGIQRDMAVTSFSVAKSFTSALVGIAIDEGYIHDVDDPITDYLPELAERDPGFEDITIRHLLLMASGLEFKEMRPFLLNGDDPLTTYYPDQRKLALENTHIIDPPGEYFQYNKYHPQLLGLILERATGTSVTEFMQRVLWEPLGMEYDGGWSLDSQESGFEKMEAGLNARAIDFAKFGQLFLDKGNWNGTQVISSGWVADSLQYDPDFQRDDYYPNEFGQSIYKDGQGYYRYMWHGYFRGDGSFDFAALGDHGQLIYVSPHKNLVIVRFGANYGIPGDVFGWTRLLYQFATDF